MGGEVSACSELIQNTSATGSGISWAYTLASSVAGNALAQGMEASGSADSGRTGLVLATTKADAHEFTAAVEQCEAGGPRLFDPFVFAQRLAESLGLRGPVMVVSNACASGLIAIVQAARLLRRGDAEQVLVVSVDVLSEFVLEGFSALNALSTGPCRPFDESRNGLSLGEGAGAMLLGIAEMSDSHLATIKGWGVSNDAHHITGPSRSGEGLTRALGSALEMSGLSTQDIEFVNAHGTGTVYNDEMEAQALSSVFGDRVPPVTSMKGYIGHTLGAAGVIEAALCTRALKDGIAPGTMGFETMGLTKPIPVAAEAKHIPQLRNVATLKSGFGGVNAAVIISASEKTH
jgi:3-oxoacyl-(acyl-carrier-protein) synthase